MTYQILNQNHTSLSTFNTISQLISHIKSLNLPSFEQFLIFPSSNQTTSEFHLITLNQLIKIYKTNPSHLN